METPGSPKGSFGASAQKIETAIRSQEEARKIQAAAERKAEDQVTEAGSARDAWIDSQLPKVVMSSVFGKVSYAQFKAMYQSIWDQIVDKAYLVTQNVRYDGLVGSIPYSLRSLKRSEERALTAYEPNPAGHARTVTDADGRARRVETTPQERSDQQLDFMTRRMVVQLIRIGDATFPSVTLTADTRKAWEEDESVKQAVAYLYDVDPVIFEHLIGVVSDIDQAKYLALLENMKNPLAQRSPTTGSERYHGQASSDSES